MELLQRDLQRQMLFTLSEIYPDIADLQRAFGEYDGRQVSYNLAYLEEHGLVAINWVSSISDPNVASSGRITAAGIDFISDDGGLSAIFNVVVVKLHEDTLKRLLIEKINQSQTEEGVKQSLIKKLKELPAEAMQQLTLQAFETGIQNLPNIALWLQKSLGL
jgi:hypothetical protein